MEQTEYDKLHHELGKLLIDCIKRNYKQENRKTILAISNNTVPEYCNGFIHISEDKREYD